MYKSHNPSYIRFLRTSAEQDADPGSVAVRANAEGEKESTRVKSQMRHFTLHLYLLFIEIKYIYSLFTLIPPLYFYFSVLYVTTLPATLVFILFCHELTTVTQCCLFLLMI